ncbi:YhfC family intramembrane metalloprotease [Effusibacillus pohliae]|uniref:YhfC family intramembrane metalloprotease n=1 Tax=Effusibacillus pohliae TaxID=232270 RepID=UPI000376E684|nr:YhfC family glutamic-type intramembrane protease [Effusibacillus pohliae]
MSVFQLACLLAAGLFCIVLPFLSFLVVKRKLPSRWRIFWIGALTFFIFQILLRLPWQIPLAAWMREHAAEGWMLVWFTLLSGLTAGLFEETGRYLAYRFFVKKPTVGDGVALGMGHGGIESALLVGVSIISASIVTYLATHQQIAIPPDQMAALAAQTNLNGPWYLNFAGAYERVMALIAHVTMSLLVYVAYTRKRFSYFLIAVVVHMAIDAGVVLFAKFTGSTLLAEVLLTAVAVAGWLWMSRLIAKERVQMDIIRTDRSLHVH